MTTSPNPWFVLGLDHGTYGRDATAAMANRLRMLRELDDPAFDRSAITSAAGDLHAPPDVPDTSHWRIPAIAWPDDPHHDGVGTLRPGPVPLARRTPPVNRSDAVHAAEQLIGEVLRSIATRIDSSRSTRTEEQ